MNDNTVCCQNASVTEPAGETLDDPLQILIYRDVAFSEQGELPPSFSCENATSLSEGGKVSFASKKLAKSIILLQNNEILTFKLK